MNEVSRDFAGPPPDSVKPEGGDLAVSTIVHVLPYDQPRGAQRYARYLVAQLRSDRDRHLILTIFRGETSGLAADLALDVPRGWLRRTGFDPRGAIRLRRVLREVKADIVVAHGGEAAKYASAAVSRETPLVYLNIGSAHPRLDRTFSSLLHGFYTGRSDVVVAVSEALGDEAVQVHGISRDKLEVIPNGRDPSVYRPAAHRRVDSRTRLIWIGQLDWTKRPEWFIESVRLLRDEGVDLEATMVGDGPRRADLSLLAQGAGVDLLGRREDVPDLIAASDVLVFTGKPPEGMPGVLIEAGMCGVACVSTRVPGADEVIDHDVTGLLVDLDDQPSLVEAIRSLAADREARRAMGDRARERCIAMYSLEATATRWREVFERLLAR